MQHFFPTPYPLGLEVHSSARLGRHIVAPMTSTAVSQKDDATPPKATRKRRISSRVRHAIEHKVHNGGTWEDAAREAGLSPSGIHKARRQTHIQAFEEETKARYIQAIESYKGVIEARALKVAEDLLDSAKSEQVKARMVEFLRREPSGPAAIVQINQQFNGGYEIAPKGARVVEIQEQTDKTSDAQGEDSQQ